MYVPDGMYLTVLLVAWIGSCSYYTSSRVAEDSAAAGGCLSEGGQGGLFGIDSMDQYKRRKKTILENTPQLSRYRKKLGNAEEETSLNVFTTWELSFQQLRSEAPEIMSRQNS